MNDMMTDAKLRCTQAMTDIRALTKVSQDVNDLRSRVQALAASDAAAHTVEEIAFCNKIRERQRDHAEGHSLEQECATAATNLSAAKDIFSKAVSDVDTITTRLQSVQNRNAKRRKEHEATASLMGMENYCTARPIPEVLNLCNF